MLRRILELLTEIHLSRKKIHISLRTNAVEKKTLYKIWLNILRTGSS